MRYPAIGLGSIGWRMGYGEDYWFAFADHYLALDEGARSALRARYPEPTQVAQGLPWTGFYARLEKH